MFKCQRCRGEFVAPIRTVIKIRRRVYRVNGRDSFGHEVVKELDLCGGCAAKAGEPRVVNPDEKLEAPAAVVAAIEPDPREGHRYQKKYERA